MLEIIAQIFNLLLYQPLFNALVLLYQYLPGHDFGLAIIILTVLIKITLYPLGAKAIQSQKELQEIQPKIKEAQEKFKNDKEKQVQATMEIYQKAKINPFSSLLPLLIQFPILIALYRLFWKGFRSEQLVYLYSFIPYPAAVSQTFLGLIDLTGPSFILAVLTGIAQFLQTKTSLGKRKAEKKSADFNQMMEKQMLYFFPIFTVMILLKLPAALALYWLTSTLFTIGQQYTIFKRAL